MASLRAPNSIIESGIALLLLLVASPVCALYQSAFGGLYVLEDDGYTTDSTSINLAVTTGTTVVQGSLVVQDKEGADAALQFDIASADIGYVLISSDADGNCVFSASSSVVTKERIQDDAWDIGGGTQTLITVTYQDSTDDVDFVVDSDLHNYSWLNVVEGDLPATITRDSEWDTLSEIETILSYDFSSASNLDTGTVSNTLLDTDLQDFAGLTAISGGLLYGAGAANWDILGPGSQYKVLKMGGVYPEWGWNSTLDASDGSPTGAVSVDGSGKVGIGTAAPDSTLDVVGNARIDTGLIVGTGAYTISNAVAKGIASQGNINVINGVWATAQQLAFGSTQPLCAVGRDASSRRLVYNSGLDSTTSAGHLWQINSVTKMAMDNTGKVGLGVAAPDCTLHVMAGDASATANASTKFLLENSDNALIEVITPNNKIGGIAFSDPDGAQRGYIRYNHSDDTMKLYAQGAERFGMGGSEVVVNDVSADVDFRVESNNNTAMLFVDGGNDRVGVGTNTPNSTLDVQSTGYTIAQFYGPDSFARASVISAAGSDAQFSCAEGTPSSLTTRWSFGNWGDDDSFHINSASGAFGSSDDFILSTAGSLTLAGSLTAPSGVYYEADANYNTWTQGFTGTQALGTNAATVFESYALPVPVNGTYTYDVDITCRVSATSEDAGYHLHGTFVYTTSPAYTLIGTATQVAVHEVDSAWNVTLACGAANALPYITIKGNAENQTMRYAGTITVTCIPH